MDHGFRFSLREADDSGRSQPVMRLKLVVPALGPDMALKRLCVDRRDATPSLPPCAWKSCARWNSANYLDFHFPKPYGDESGPGRGIGEGTVSGGRLSGTIKWSNHPQSALRWGGLA